MIISFDVGIKNLAYCILHKNSRIHKWEVVTITGNDIYEQSASLFNILNDIVNETDNIEIALIENQPCNKNPKMKSIQIMIFSFFELQKIKTQLISASNKLKVKQNDAHRDKLTYSQKKRKGIELALVYLDSEIERDILRSSKKKDDLADCFLQGIFWLEKNDLI
jgi:hypothetical protein